MQTNNKDNNDFYFSNNESTVAQMNKQIRKEKKILKQEIMQKVQYTIAKKQLTNQEIK